MSVSNFAARRPAASMISSGDSWSPARSTFRDPSVSRKARAAQDQCPAGPSAAAVT